MDKEGMGKRKKREKERKGMSSKIKIIFVGAAFECPLSFDVDYFSVRIRSKGGGYNFL